MKLAVVALTVLGVLAAGSAAFVVQMMKANSAVPTANVVVMQSDLPATTTLTADHVKLEAVPRAALPKGCLVATSQAVGRMLRVPLLKGQVVTEPALVAPGSPAEAAGKLPPGMTVATVVVPSRSINLALLYPGCYVHVGASVREGVRSEAKTISGTLFKGMQVLSIGDEPGGLPSAGQEQAKAQSAGASGTIKVNLLATDEQERILQVAGERGTITLTIRNPREVAQSGSQTELVADENLRKALGLVPDQPPVANPIPPEPNEAKKVEPAPEEPSQTVEVIEGLKVTRKEFPPKGKENGRN